MTPLLSTRTFRAALIALGVTMTLAAAAPAHAQFIDAKVVSLDAAKKIAAAAEAEARTRGWTVAIAVVDVSGGLILFHRIDDVQTGSLDVAIAKARTAARFKRSTRVFFDAVAKGNVGILSLSGAVPVPGGLPITVDGKVIGAIGVSGMTSDQDETIAQAGLDALPH
jgi:glc operon protein GlcG